MKEDGEKDDKRRGFRKRKLFGLSKRLVLFKSQPQMTPNATEKQPNAQRKNGH